MSGLKFQYLRPVVLIIIIISAIYFLALLKLLQPHNENIALTKKEITGALDFKIASSLYFELYKTQEVQMVAEKLLLISSNHNNKAWNKAKDSLRNMDSTSFSNVSDVFRHLIRDIGDESELILDSKLPVYYSVNLIFNNVPLLMENINVYNKKPTNSLQSLPYNLENIEHSLRFIDDTKCKQCTSLNKLVAQIKDGLISYKSLSATAGHKLILIKEVEKITNSSSDILMDLLQDRLNNQTLEKNIVLVIVLLLYAISVKLVVFSLNNYVSKREVDLAKERQLLIVQLAQKNNELEQFAYAAAHDLKEPIRTMRCFATLLKNESESDLTPTTNEYIRIIENTAKRAEQMINDLLDYTKVGEETLAVELCDCRKELEAVLEDLESSIKKLKPEITILQLPKIKTVPSMFRRVMLNLLDNAIKYRSVDTPLKIKITAEKQDKNWLFSVRDNGIGISENHVETVFEPFKRLEKSSNKDGSGVGLTSCRKVIETLGGNIWITPNIESGITVSFSLPIKSA